MRFQSRWKIAAICALALLTNITSVVAQSNKQEKAKPTRDVIVERRGGTVIAGSGQEAQWSFMDHDGDGKTFTFISGEMSFDGQTVKGAPYAAQAISESIQTLADGNRIVHKSTASVYRDGEGRTRRDQTLAAIGPYASAGDPPQTSFINDPVAGVNYILDPRSRTARKLPLPWLKGKPGDHVFIATEGAAKRRSREDAAKDIEMKEGAMKERQEMIIAAGPGMPPGPRPGAAFEYHRTKLDPKNAKQEALGTQNIEGVMAEGTRSTITIPAGEIGNELPIQIVTERWYSPELKTIVMSKHTDPRMGEHNYRLTNITLGEPARTLFEVPADYTVKDSMPGQMKMRIERELQNGPRKQQDEKDF